MFGTTLRHDLKAGYLISTENRNGRSGTKCALIYDMIHGSRIQYIIIWLKRSGHRFVKASGLYVLFSSDNGFEEFTDPWNGRCWADWLGQGGEVVGDGYDVCFFIFILCRVIYGDCWLWFCCFFGRHVIWGNMRSINDLSFAAYYPEYGYMYQMIRVFYFLFYVFADHSTSPRMIFQINCAVLGASCRLWLQIVRSLALLTTSKRKWEQDPGTWNTGRRYLA